MAGKRSILLRFSEVVIDHLDLVCSANQRSRRAIIQILIQEAYLELLSDPEARINPVTIPGDDSGDTKTS